MDKYQIIETIIKQLQTDHNLLLDAAKHAHRAATHEENIPDNKYDTLALEASYIAQGQANRAQQIETALQLFKTLQVQQFTPDSPIRLTALVKLADAAGDVRYFFLAPAAGGMLIPIGTKTVRVITPDSPLGKKLLGRQQEDTLTHNDREFDILSVS